MVRSQAADNEITLGGYIRNLPVSAIELKSSCFVAKNCGMPHRKLRVVRLTPIALALCEHCNGQFHSLKRGQEEAKAELMAQFDAHECVVKAHADPANE